MNRVGSILAGAAGVGLVAGAVYLPIWLGRRDPPPASVTQKPSQVTLADIPDATLVGRHAGHRVWQIHAGRILAAADGHTTTFLNVDQGTLYEHDRPAAHVAARHVVYNDVTLALRATEGLSVRASGVTVQTATLGWNARTGHVLCAQPLTAAWEGGAARADHMEADTRLRVLTLNNASMVQRLEGPVFDKFAKRIGAASGASLALLLSSTAPAPAAGYKEVHSHADLTRLNQTTNITTLDGGVTFINGDTRFRADHAVYNKATGTATATGHIMVENPRNLLEGDTGDVDFNAKVVRLHAVGGVKMVVRPSVNAKPGSAAARVKEPVTVLCRDVTYHYKEKRAEAAGPITVTRSAQTVTGDTGTYMAQDEIITLMGHVHGRDEKGQTFDAPSLRMSLRAGDEWVEAPNVQSTFYVKDEDVPVATGTPKR